MDNNYWPKPGAKNLFCCPVVNDLFNGRCYPSFEQLGPGKQSKPVQVSLSSFRRQMTKALMGLWDQCAFEHCRYPVFVLRSHGNRIIATPPWTGSSSIAELLPALYRPYRSFAFTHLSQWRSTSQSLFSVTEKEPHHVRIRPCVTDFIGFQWRQMITEISSVTQAINQMTLSRLLCLGKYLQPRVGQVREIPKAWLGFPAQSQVSLY